jgi:hypothetical protein
MSQDGQASTNRTYLKRMPCKDFLDDNAVGGYKLNKQNGPLIAR